ncbi:hypothetical protein A2U01_0082879, partial [Trifolium medium]|nr:hypothetical protein [Trifolium medium]
MAEDPMSSPTSIDVRAVGFELILTWKGEHRVWKGEHRAGGFELFLMWKGELRAFQIADKFLKSIDL